MYGGPKWTVSPVYEGMLKEEMDAAAGRHPDVRYSPVLIDATYAGLVGPRPDAPLVIPALNRDGDCLSDLVLPLFGSIAGAESVLLALDAELRAQRGHGRGAARHRARAARQGRGQPDGHDPGRGRAAGVRGRARPPGTRPASEAIYAAVLDAVEDGVSTPDLGGHASTTEFTDAVIERVKRTLST